MGAGVVGLLTNQGFFFLHQSNVVTSGEWGPLNMYQ